MQYGPKVEWNALQEGVRIYYTGDMANSSDHGVITKRHPIDPKWGYRKVDILLDDGRIQRGIHCTNFQPAPGRRFWLEMDWQADRERRIAEFKAWADAQSAKRAVQP